MASSSQRVPFQRMASVRVATWPAGAWPAAMHRVGLVHDTSASPPPGPGVGSLRQREPFQDAATLKPTMPFGVLAR